MPENNFQAPGLNPQEPGYFNATFPNPPPTPITTAYRFNHLALRIKDPSRSLHFYIDLLGMRVIFTMNAGPFTIYYLGHPPPEADTSEEVAAWAKRTSEIPAMTRTSGLLELYHVHGSENVDGAMSTGNVAPHLGFAHLGFTVPDVGDAVRRLREGGVVVIKDIGVCGREVVPLSGWEEGRGVGVGEIQGNYAWFFEKFAMVADPVSWYL
jgi:lactoylglutathione lyase